MSSVLSPPMAALLGVLVVVNTCGAALLVPGLTQGCYSVTGHLNIGFMTSITRRGSGHTQLCSTSIFRPHATMYVHAFVWAVNRVNLRPDLLPNITLGFVVRDECFSNKARLAQAMLFLPDDKGMGNASDTEAVEDCGGAHTHTQVVGVIGLASSRAATVVSSVLGIFHIPTLSPLATSDDLSDKSRYEYFSRLVPADKYQAHAILDLVSHLNWTYISLVYSEGSYGENGAKQIEQQVRQRDVCIAFSQMLFSADKDEDIQKVIKNLMANSRARVVVTFLEVVHVMRFFTMVNKTLGSGTHKLWVGSDSMGFVSLGKVMEGALIIHHAMNAVPDFEDYYLSLTPATAPPNPWSRADWERIFNCQWEPVTGQIPCSEFINRTIGSTQTFVGNYVSPTVDSVDVFARALDALIRNKCPEAFLNPDIVRQCVTGYDVLSRLRQVDFEGVNGRIRFESNGDVVGAYEIKQYSSVSGKRLVGHWDQGSMQLSMYEDLLDWSFLADDIGQSTPTSICSEPCPGRHYVVPGETPCCWTCRPCNKNEVVDANLTQCIPCALLTWPDPEDGMACVPITPTFLGPHTSTGATLTSLIVIGGLLVVITVTLLAINQKHKLIKASSREMVAFTMLGILLALITATLKLLRPSSSLCLLARLGFNLSITLIFGPLVVKTVRVYRIFKRSIPNPRCIRTSWQVLLVSSLFIIQAALTMVSLEVAPAVARLRMPITSKPYVELSCSLPSAGLLIPLTFNLLLLVVASVLGFVTRSLPENFNESWYIFVSVATTAFLWVVFLPAYFITFYAVQQAALLAFWLFINATTTLLVLFVPKLYAVYYVPETSMKFHTHGVTTASVHPTGSSHNTQREQLEL